MNRTINREDAKPGDRVTVKLGRSTIVGTVVGYRNPGHLDVEVEGWKSPYGDAYTMGFYPHDDLTIEVEEESFTDRFDASPIGTVALYAPDGVVRNHGHYVKTGSGIKNLQTGLHIERKINSATAASQFAWSYPES